MKEEKKEGFCGACVAGVAALLGAGTAGVTAKDRKSQKKIRNIIFWIGISVCVVSIIFALYFLMSCQTCKGGSRGKT